MGLKKGHQSLLYCEAGGRKRGLQPPALLPFCFPFWEVGKGVYWLVRLVHVWRVEQRQDFRLYVDSIPELARLEGFLTLPPTPSLSASSLAFRALSLPVKLQWPAELAASVSVLHVAAGQPPSRAVSASEWRRRVGPGLARSWTGIRIKAAGQGGGEGHG